MLLFPENRPNAIANPQLSQNLINDLVLEAIYAAGARSIRIISKPRLGQANAWMQGS
jgi:hypothetical protein